MPKLDTGTDIGVNRLRRAMEHSRKLQKPFRRRRTKMILQQVGTEYSDDGADKPVPVNFMRLARGTLLRHLVASSPRALVTTFHNHLRPAARKMRLGLNQLIDEMRLLRTISSVTGDALDSIGILKLALDYSGTTKLGEGDRAETSDIYDPFASRISLDDWVHDMLATSWDQVDFMANRMRVPFDELREDDSFSNLDGLSPNSDEAIDFGHEDKARDISQGESLKWDEEIEYRSRIDLWDIYLPYDQLMVTVPAQKMDRVIRQEKWEGPSGGPFHILGFDAVSDQTMPMSPGSMLINMHRVANALFRKLSEDAVSAKVVFAVQATSEAAEDADRIIRATNREVVKVHNPDNVRELKFGGPDQATTAFFIQLKQLISYFAGNLDMMGGLGAMSPTATQDQMLQSASSKQVSAMQEKVVEFTEEVINDLAWYEWSNPLLDRQVEDNVPGLGSMGLSLQQHDLVGRFLDYHFNIEAYSLQRQTPNQRLQAVTQVVNTIAIPLAAQLSEQGHTIDVPELIRLYAEYGNIPELANIVTAQGQPMDVLGSEGGMQRQTTPSPAVTTRQYERISRPGATPQGAEQVLQQALLGQESQPAMNEALARSIG